ncbi:MAG TPA: glycosyltransferase [Thermoanaerobaculia bacterium]
MDEIGIIVVSWHDAPDLYAAVESLAAARARVPADGPRARLTVVVNGGDASPRQIAARWPDAEVVVNAENRGYAAAANQGAAGTPSNILLFLNPDTRAEGDPFTAIARGFRERPEAAALAPRLLDAHTGTPDRAAGEETRLAPPGNENQFTFQLRALPTILSDARELLLIDHLFPNNRARRRDRYADRDPERPIPVAQAAAAALAVRGEAFRRVGGFAEDFTPAWFEDVDLCARLAPIGQILYWPAARFRHRGGAASARLGYAKFLPLYYLNAMRYRRRHYGFAARAVYRLLLPAGMLLRLAALPLRRSDPRPKGESARAYLSVLRLSLGLGPSSR